MKIVGAGLRDHSYGCPARKALLRVEVVRYDVYRFDSLRRWYVGCMMRQPQKYTERTIDARGIIVTIYSVYIGGECPRWSGLNGVLVLARRGAWDKIDEALIIAVLRQRHIDHVFGAEFGVHISRIRLECDSSGVHCYA